MANNDLFENTNQNTAQVMSGTQLVSQEQQGETKNTEQPVQDQTSFSGIGNYDPETFKAPSGASVSQRLLDLLDKNNPYITRAKTSAQQAALSRGLQNSTMAATAGEAAAIDAAAPIAQADAELFTNLYGNDQTARNQSELYKLQGDISSKLATQQGDIDLKKLKAQGDIDIKKIAAQGDVDAALQEAQNVWEDKFLQDKIALEQSQLSSDNQRIAMESFNTIQSEFQKDWLEILINPNFASTSDRQKALDDLVASTQSRIQSLSTLYNIELEWVAPETVGDPVEEEITTEHESTAQPEENPDQGGLR